MTVTRVAERLWTNRELVWKERLKNDPWFELITLEEALAESPDPQAVDNVRKKYGDVPGGVWCKFIMAYTSMQMLTNTVCLLDGVLNCAACSRTYKSVMYNNRGIGFLHTPTTGMNRSQVIFGGEEALADAIKAVDRDYKPSLIVIMTGCAPLIIQDDIPRIVETLQPQVKAKILYIPTAGYEATIMEAREQHVRFYTEIMDPPKQVDRDKVNILGNEKEPVHEHVCGFSGTVKYPGDSEELGRMLEGIGLKLHRVLLNGDYEYIRSAPEAGLNTLNCVAHGLPLAQAMKEKFGTPYTYYGLPLGFEAASKWLRLVAQATGREEEAEGFIRKEWEAIKDDYERAREAVAGKVAFCGGNQRGLSFLRFCKELGMDVVEVGIGGMGGGLGGLKGMRHEVECYLANGFNSVAVKCHDGMPLEERERISRPENIMEKLGINEDEVVYMYTDFPPYARAGKFDPSNVARLDSSVHMRKMVGFPSRAVGFKGTQGWCRMIVEAVKAARRKKAPTLYGRLFGKSFDFVENRP